MPHNAILQSLITDAESLLDRHIGVLNDKPEECRDHEVFELRETIAEAKRSLRANLA